MNSEQGVKRSYLLQLLISNRRTAKSTRPHLFILALLNLSNINRMIKSTIIQSFLFVRPNTTCRKSVSALVRFYSESHSEKCALSVYSTLSKRKEPLKLKNSNVLYWYSCGPTVYDSAHIGHARLAPFHLSFDLNFNMIESSIKLDMVLIFTLVPTLTST